MDVVELANKVTKVTIDVNVEVEHREDGIYFNVTCDEGYALYQLLFHEGLGRAGVRRIELVEEDDAGDNLLCAQWAFQEVEKLTHDGRTWCYVGVLDAWGSDRTEEERLSDPFDEALVESIEKIKALAERLELPCEEGRHHRIHIEIPGGQLSCHLWQRCGGLHYEVYQQREFREVEEIEAHITTLRKGKEIFELFKRTCF